MHNDYEYLERVGPTGTRFLADLIRMQTDEGSMGRHDGLMFLRELDDEAAETKLLSKFREYEVLIVLHPDGQVELEDTSEREWFTKITGKNLFAAVDQLPAHFGPFTPPLLLDSIVKYINRCVARDHWKESDNE